MARGWASQLVGAMGRRSGNNALGPGVALGLPGCCRVHTFFVASALDVVFCDQAGRVVGIVASLAPFRVGPGVRGPIAVAWEMRAGSLAPFVAHGDVLREERKG